MKSKKTVFFCLVIMIVLSTACGKGGSKSGTLQEMNYDDFKDEINDSNFTGFAYMLTDQQASDNNYIDILKEIFKNNDKQLVFYSDLDASDDEQQKSNEDSTDPNIIFPMDEITFIKNGKKISTIDLTDSILSDRGYKKVANFVENHNG